MIPNFAALIAIFILALLTKLLDTHFALVLIYVGGAIPMNTWLMKGYLDTIPKERDNSKGIAMNNQQETKVILRIISRIPRDYT